MIKIWFIFLENGSKGFDEIIESHAIGDGKCINVSKFENMDGVCGRVGYLRIFGVGYRNRI